MMLPVSLQLQNFVVQDTHQSGNKLLTASIIMYILATTWTEAHATPHTCIVGSRTTNSAEMAAGGRAWRSHCCLQIRGNMRRQRFEICLFCGKKLCKKNYRGNSNQNMIQAAFPVTSCKSSRNVLGAFLASRAFACRVLRLVPFGCFFCIYPASGGSNCYSFFLQHHQQLQ